MRLSTFAILASIALVGCNKRDQAAEMNEANGTTEVVETEAAPTDANAVDANMAYGNAADANAADANAADAGAATNADANAA